MSAEALQHVFDFSPCDGPKHHMLIVLAHLSKDHRAPFTACASFSTIARMARVCERQAKRTVAELLDALRLSVTKGGGRTQNTYELHLIAKATRGGESLPPGVALTTPLKQPSTEGGVRKKPRARPVPVQSGTVAVIRSAPKPKKKIVGSHQHKLIRFKPAS